MGEVEIYSPLGAPYQGMRPYHSACLVLAALVSLALAQELGYDKLSYDELAELSYDKLEELSFEQVEEIEELSYVKLSYDAMLAAEDERKAQAKGTCKRTGPKLTDKNTKEYTMPYPENKCPCWWDLSKNNCACCKEGTDAMQCGWPMHKYCYKKSDKGCPGVCNNAFTLSGKGFPCQNDPNNKNCAWCTKTGFQCFPDAKNGPNSEFGSRCQAQNQQKYCKSVQGDCRHISGACPPDRCEKQGKVPGKPYKHLTYYECECPAGYTGNGLQCYDENDGTLLVTEDAEIELEMTLKSEVETFPFDPNTDLPTGVELQDLIDQMGSVDSSCSSGSDCTSSFNINEINN